MVPVITGLGLVTPLGNGVEQTWSALLDGEYIKDHARTRLDATSPDRVHALAIAAAGEALAEARWTDRAAGEHRTAVVAGTSKGAIEAWASGQSFCWGLSSIASAVRGRWPLLDGPALTVSAACASGLHALIRAAMMIRSGEADRVLVVAAEASVNPLFLASFRRLGVLPKEGVGCKPFDEHRDGFLMSEAAAAVCLESAETENAGRPYAQVERFAMGGDAAHITGGDASGATLRRLLRAVIDRRAAQLIHAHATGTEMNDPVELAAISDECIVDEAHPMIYSHKGPLGHSLGAAGLVSVVLNCLSHRHGVVPGNVQTHHPLPAPRLRLTRELQTGKIDRSIAIAAGFGGALAVVALTSP
jgi:3-oxoacyl-[acyl-carrier-protein] synthase II